MVKDEKKKRSIVSMELSTFEIPPAGDILVLGKRSPIGSQAAKKMLDTVVPNQFELIQPEDDLIEGILVKKCLFSRTDKKALIKAILEESSTVMDPQCMLRIQCEITVKVERTL